MAEVGKVVIAGRGVGGCDRLRQVAAEMATGA